MPKNTEMKLATRGTHDVRAGIDSVRWKFEFWRDNPDFFYPDGIWVFCGPQGSGKTLSAVQAVQNVCDRFPKCVLCTNMWVGGISNRVVPFERYSQLYEMSNGTEGIVYLIDEIHVLWNSLESKSIPPSEMACFCQMRKDRRLVIGTSQVYNRIAKPIREQLKYVFDCHNLFSFIQVNERIDPTSGQDRDGHLVGANTLGRYWFFHSPDLYQSYETFNKIRRASRA